MSEVKKCQVIDLMPALIILHLLINIFIGMTETFNVNAQRV